MKSDGTGRCALRKMQGLHWERRKKRRFARVQKYFSLRQTQKKDRDRKGNHGHETSY
jgi:hypothetical protein